MQIILVADDDLDNRIIACEILQSSGYAVREAANGFEVLEAVAREKPDIILLDLSMPKLDGWKTAERLRKDPAMKNIPIIAFTAHAMPGDEDKARQSGCDDYITKPYPPKKIIEKVREWLERGQ